MNAQPVINFNNVCFGYEQTEVLHNVSFSLFEHQSVCIVGPNGGGKTTLIKLILGLNRAAGRQHQRSRGLAAYKQPPYRLHASKHTF